jgi:hypothetical protein
MNLTDTPKFDPRTTCGKPCNCESYRAHLLSVGISATATPSRAVTKETNEAIEREKRWEKDMPAYARLRKEGLQPKHVDGAAAMESGANDKLEIEAGTKLAGGTLEVVKEIRELNAERAAS